MPLIVFSAPFLHVQAKAHASPSAYNGHGLHTTPCNSDERNGTQMGMKHQADDDSRGKRRIALIVTVVALAIAVCLAVTVWALSHRSAAHNASQQTSSQSAASNTANSSDSAAPSTSDSSKATSSQNDAQARADSIVGGMSLDDRAGQLVMAALQYGTDASSLQSVIEQQHVGNVILMGNWTSGVQGVASASNALQSYASQTGLPALLIATDQEGGMVQHLTGAGFATIPSAVEQGRMSVDQLRSSAASWAAPLKQSGVNVDLAPSVDTVTIDRASNAPIGALDRDFGLDAQGNAEHAVAFIEGMRDGGIGSAVKHYPGLGSVQGNTDFTADGITDTSTTSDSAQIQAFTTAIKQGKPAMVMMSLATYSQIDPNTPAAFSHKIVTDILRNGTPYDGVVISDSLSASAVGNVATDQLGVRLIEAGGDLACVNSPDYTQPIVDGIREKAATDADFAAQVTASAKRVIKLKIELGLI